MVLRDPNKTENLLGWQLYCRPYFSVLSREWQYNCHPNMSFC
jgi:hypothetical protein